MRTAVAPQRQEGRDAKGRRGRTASLENGTTILGAAARAVTVSSASKICACPESLLRISLVFPLCDQRATIRISHTTTIKPNPPLRRIQFRSGLPDRTRRIGGQRLSVMKAHMGLRIDKSRGCFPKTERLYFEAS